MKHTYTPPVSQLLTYGDCRDFKDWPDYPALGFTEAHIPELIRMAGDEELLWAMSDTLEVWAPVHAWRTLGQLKAKEAIPVLLDHLDLVEDNDDWAGEDIPKALGMMGPKVISHIENYVILTGSCDEAKVAAVNAFLYLYKENNEYKQKVIPAIAKCLEKYIKNDPEINGNLISCACEMKAVELLPIIQKAFDAERVDYMFVGDFEDAEIHMGVKEKRSRPSELVWVKETGDTYEVLQSPENKEPVAAPVKKKKKIGRNAPCPCGSGKKYKKCCLGKKTK